MPKQPRIINGRSPLILPQKDGFDQDTENCIELLESMLDSARKGDMTWLVVIAGGPRDYGVAHVGNNAAQMNMGIDVAKQAILSRVKTS